MDFILENPREDLEISINTNLGVPRELIDKLIKYAKQLDASCKECQIYTSCESHGEQAEYARDGMRLRITGIVNCQAECLAETECRVVTMTTIEHALSLPGLVPKFLGDIIQLRKEYDELGSYQHRTPISFNYLRFPPHLAGNAILPEKIREQICLKIL